MIKIFDGQTYELAGTHAHTRRDGKETFLLVWRSHCAECNEPFLTRTPGLAGVFAPSRRCNKHKRPGSPCDKHKQPGTRVRKPLLSLRFKGDVA